jgi:hypothetical protein
LFAAEAGDAHDLSDMQCIARIGGDFGRVDCGELWLVAPVWCLD